MNMFNLLAGIAAPVYGETFEVSLNWIGELIKGLITLVGSVGVGIILFSIILKIIVLPFDVYQRIAMRKQNLTMKENQAKMEKLQKQYANDKEMYNKKLMEMYKESGISMFSSCLPMILSLVIFIVAINAFNAYAQYSNIENYNVMVDAYKGQYEYYCADLKTENISLDGNTVIVQEENKIIYYTTSKPEGYDAMNSEEKITAISGATKSYYIDKDNALANAEISAFVAEKQAADSNLTQESAISAYFVDKAQTAVVDAYEKEVKNSASFLWIKNIWVTDASYKHPVLDYSGFQTEVSREEFDLNGEDVSFSEIQEKTNVYGKEQYETITAKLGKQKSEANGYFILIILSIGTILLQQWLSMRSQKEQQKFSSVDGQGASQQKMTMIIMTIMFAIFSFMYSSAFSIYMIMSNVLSLISMFVINYFVDKAMAKKEEAATMAKFNGRYARVQNAQNKNENKKK